MAKFFVGQRVKLVRGLDLSSPANNFGLEGRIAEVGFWRAGLSTFTKVPLAIDCDVKVAWDGEGRCYFQHTLQLEPILPEGHAPSVYSYEELMDRCREGVAA